MVLIERGPQLEALVGYAAEAAAGAGRLVFLGGEAGVGKTAVVSLLCADQPHLTLRRGGCDSLTTTAALGPLVEALPELAETIEGTEAHRRLELFRRVRSTLTASPTLLVLEDVHWADEATLELLRFLGRRLRDAPLMVVATFRDDEVGPGARLVSVLGDLASLAGVIRLHLSTLTLAGVETLVDRSRSPIPAATLHARTGGNPFYVTEVLASGSAAPPPTVRDAVLARVARASASARGVLGAAAIAGPGAELALLATISGQPDEAVDECVARGLLVADPATARLSFRHEIARETVASSLPPTQSSRLHAALLVRLGAAPVPDHRRLAHHADGCGDAASVLRHAPLAAGRAARLGAHREAAELLRRALAHAGGLGPTEAAALEERLSYECYLIDELEEAFAARLRALELRAGAGDQQQLGVDQRWLSRLSWFLGRGEQSKAYGEQAVTTLATLPPDRELAMAYSNVSQLAMLSGDWRTADDFGRRALELARSVGDHEVEAHALNNLGTSLMAAGEVEQGRTRLAQSLDLSLAEDLHEHAARAYTNLGATLVGGRRLAEADRILLAGIGYCADRDLDSWLLYMSAWRAVTLAEQGRWPATDAVVAEIDRHHAVPAITRIPTLAVAAQLAARRQHDGVADLLAEAQRLAAGTGEAQRLVPVAAAAAEAAWLGGRAGDIPRILAPVLTGEETRLGAWAAGELSWWLAVGGGQPSLRVPVAEPFALMLRGRRQEAARVWEELGCPYWTALALAGSPELADARRGLEILEQLGATATRAAVLRDRHAAGQPVPRAPRRQTRDSPAGLTAREAEVLGQLVAGRTNAEIARELFLSEKTVDHHVSAVLRKLGEPTRAGAVAAALTRGLIPGGTDANMGDPPDAPH